MAGGVTVASPNPWDDFMKNSQKFVDAGHLENEENDYKLAIGRQLATARSAVLADTNDWANLVKKGLAHKHHPVDWRVVSDFNKWCKDAPDIALKALQALWIQGDHSVEERIDAFTELLPAHPVIRAATGARTTLASSLLMGIDAKKYPPYKTVAFKKAYDRTGYGNPPNRADEAVVYEHALEFLDALIGQAEEHGLKLEHRLSAQGLVWRSQNSDFWISADTTEVSAHEAETQGVSQPTTEASPTQAQTPPEQASLYTIDDIIKEGCFLERANLETILARLRDKQNLILQGPPGTGKTWLAKKLAFALIGRKDDSRVRRLQFHPNLSYEDFVRGYRPSGDGKLTLIDGPFLQVAIQAADDPDNHYVLVIEEINRGNPAQIFGETLTLMEADKRSEEYALALAYPRTAGERVHLPTNLYIIGTMNVADRSIAMVDLALRRRFAFVDLEPTFGEVWRNWVKEFCGIPLDFLADIERKIVALNEQIAADRELGPQFRVGHSVVTPPPGPVIHNPTEWFRQVVETEIGPLLEEYWFDDTEKAKNAKSELLSGL